jgi:hypothetical protein
MTQETYFCSCGCNLEFYLYKPGLDIYVGNNLYNKNIKESSSPRIGHIITSLPMKKYCWEDYVPTYKFTTWGELKNYIIIKYNEKGLQNGEPFIHLYNDYINNDNIPLDGILQYECAF